MASNILTSDERQKRFGCTWRSIPCPLCGGESIDQLFPTLKFDLLEQKYVTHPEIYVSACRYCGLIFENPQVALDISPNYTDGHYYNASNPVFEHDKGQRTWNVFRWHVVKNYLPSIAMDKVLDVGASGSWSDWILKREVTRESILVEPSSEAISLCLRDYKDVRAVQSTFEAFTDEPRSFDLITFFYSLYMIADPVPAIQNAHSLLKPDGRLVICISQLHMDVEIWTGGVPWLNLAQLNRAVPLVYYSQRTLRLLLETNGFEIMEDFVFEFPEWHEWNGRQEFYVITKPKKDWVPLKKPEIEDPKESLRAIHQFKNYTEICSHNSVSAFLRKSEIKKLYVCHDGDVEYAAWIYHLLNTFDISATLIEPGKYQKGCLTSIIEDKEGSFVCFAGDHNYPVEENSSRFIHTRLVNASLRTTDNFYGNMVSGKDGKRIPARAFCPYIQKDEQLFPFRRRLAVNNVKITAEEIEYYSDVIGLPDQTHATNNTKESHSEKSRVDIDLSRAIANLAIKMDDGLRAKLLRPFQDIANSSQKQNKVVAPAMSPDTLNVDDIELLVSQAMSHGTHDEQRALVEHILYFREMLRSA